jgi:PAS domain S-box-containing protein
VIFVDLAQTIVWANEAALCMHQVGSTAELGRTIDAYHAKFQVRYVAVLGDPAEGEEIDGAAPCGCSQPDVLMELRPLRGADATCTHRTRKMVLPDENGQPSCTVLFMRKVAAAADGAGQLSEPPQTLPSPTTILQTSEQGAVAEHGTPAEPGITPALPVLQARAADIAAICPAAMHVLDEEMRIVEVSQRWLEWLGYTRDTVIGRKIFDFMPTASAEHFERHVQQQPANAGHLRDMAAEFMTKSGATVHAIVSARSTDGERQQAKLLIAVCVDVTAQRRSEDALAAMFAASPVPMLIRKCDDPRVIDANDAFLQATDFNVSGIVGHGFDEFGVFETRGRKDQFEAAIRGNGRIEPVDVSLKTAHGDALDCVLTATRLWAFGKPCVLLTLQDVSERRRTEAELMSAIEAVMKDSAWFSRSVVERLAALRAPPKSGRRAAALGDLTPRERDVLSLISLGLPDAEIADRLGLTRSTIRNHLSTLYSKISVHNRGSAIIWARERCINITQLPARGKPVQAKFRPAGGGSPKQIIPLSQPGWGQEAKSAAGD